MSEQSDPIVPEDLIFYVDKLESDFTFYLDAKSHRDNKKINALFEKATLRKAKQFSLSEQITFTTAESTLWARLGDANDPAGRYLLRKLQAAATEDDKELVEKLTAASALSESPALSDSEQKRLAGLLMRALSPENRIDLANEEWLKTLNLTQGQKATLDELKLGDGTKVPDYLLDLVFPEWKKEKGRALICLSHVGKYLSVTVRKLKKDAGYEPKSCSKDEQTRSKDRQHYLFSVEEYCAPIEGRVFLEQPNSEHGLLVITGPTKSMKSEITRGLIYLYLKKRKEQELLKAENLRRTPHLITFEDPIEMYYADHSIKGHPYVALSLNEQEGGINYTPRQKPSDAGLLEDVLSDALRQTPTVFFVGETRSKEEWEVLLDFAATGHLIVTTAHAGSLVEAMRKIFEARKVNTPAARGEVANKLLAVVNLKPGKIKTDAGSTEVVFPALWRRTPRGVAGLTSDGLSALLPQANTADRPSCLGRRSFIDELLGNLGDDLPNDLPLAFGSGEFEKVMIEARKQASNWDLQGV